MRNLFYTGFNPAGLCYDPVTMLVAATAIGAGGQIFSGASAYQNAKKTASLEEEQARIALDESNRAADQKVKEQRKFVAEQRMAYLANGVSLEGTPGIVESDTFSEFQQEIDAIRKSGVAQFKYGMTNAANTRSTGRSQMISGFFNAAGTLMGGASQLKASSGSLTRTTDQAIRDTGYIHGRM